MTAYTAPDPPDKPPDIVTISRFRHKRDTAPRQERQPWDGLTRLLSRHAVRREKDGPLWSPVRFRPGTERAAANVEAVTELVYDVDHVPPDWNLLDGVAFVAYTTYSHTADDPHWRLVLRLARPVPAAAWATVWRRGRARYAPMADPACSDPGRMYYLPTCRPGQRGAAQIGEGTPVEPDALPETPQEVEERALAAAQPASRPPGAPAGAPGGGERPGDRFASQVTWAELLEPHGWRTAGTLRGQEVWRRPGRTENREARSANTTRDGNLWVWTSSAPPFEPRTSYTKLHAYVLLEHRSDWTAAIKALAERYGMVRPDYGRASFGISSSAGAGTPGEDEEDTASSSFLSTYPVSALPEGVRELVAHEARVGDIAAGYVATPLLAVAGAMIGGSARVRVTERFTEPPGLYVATVGLAGSGKSPGLNVTARPIYRLQSDAFAAYTGELKAWEQRQAGRERPDPADPKPRLEHFYTKDMTWEAVTKLLAGGRGVCVLAHEVAALFTGMNAHRGGKGADREHLLAAWDGEQDKTDRKTQETSLVDRPVLCVAGGVQPDKLRCFGETTVDDGMLSRFLWDWPEDRVSNAGDETEADARISRRNDERLLALLRRLRGLTGGAGAAPRIMHLDVDARAVWRAWRDENADLQQRTRLPLVRSLFSKFARHALRLALVLHLLEWAAGTGAQGEEPPAGIPGRTFAAALCLVEYYRLQGLRVLYRLGGGRPGVEGLPKRLLGILDKEAGAWLKRTDLYEGMGRPASVSADALSAALQQLRDAGWAEREPTKPTGQRGRPAERWRSLRDAGLPRPRPGGVIAALRDGAPVAVGPVEPNEENVGMGAPQSGAPAAGHEETPEGSPKEITPAWPGAGRPNGYAARAAGAAVPAGEREILR